MADRIPTDLERQVRKRYTELFNQNKTVESVFKKIRQGRATYKDASDFSEEIGKILAKVFKGIDLDGVDLNDLAYNIVGNAMKQNIALSDLTCESVQSILNESAGVGLKPVTPKKNPEKIKGIQDLVANAESEEAVRVALDEPVITNVMSNVDDWVRTNADFQGDAGMKPIIVRTWSGSYPSHDTKHTDWCESLAGTFEYGKEPKDVYKRHNGCRCTVEYFPNAKSKGRITAMAKGEKASSGTGTSKKQQTTVEQRRVINGDDEARRILNAEWT